MVKPRASAPANEDLDCDVCIIGAGAAGLTVALEFLGKPQKVLVVEAGALDGRQTNTSLYEGESVNPTHPAPHMYRHRRLGGSSVVWGGRCIPFDPIDFERRDYIPDSGWPIALSGLDPYYRRAQEILEAGAFDYQADTAIRRGALVAGFSDAAVRTDGLERFSLPTNFWREYRQVIAASPNVEVIADSTATRLEGCELGRVEALSCVGGHGSPFRIRARVFIVAVGGLETVRLLGHSRVASDMLGRTYMCHVENNVGQLRLTPKDRPVTYGFERTTDGVYARRRFTLAPDRQRALQVTNVAVRPHHPGVGDPSHGHPVLSAMFLAKRFIIPEYAARFAAAEHSAGLVARHLRNVVLGAPRLAAFTMDWTARRYMSRRRLPYVALRSEAGIYPLDLNAEQAPNRDSRVTLSGDLDRHGVPRLVVDWRVTDLDCRSIATTLRELRDAMRRSGCGDVDFEDETLDDQVRDAAKPVPGHHIGTARMADDPSQGVVDTDCRVHGVDNVYVAGAATFPTSSHANPTLTIVALAARLAEHLGARLAGERRAL